MAFVNNVAVNRFLLHEIDPLLIIPLTRPFKLPKYLMNCYKNILLCLDGKLYSGPGAFQLWCLHITVNLLFPDKSSAI